MAEAAQKIDPSVPNQAWKRQEEAVKLVRDVYAGTARLREEAETYLPRFPKETTDGYKIRKTQAVLFNAFKRTAKGLVGLLFRKPLQPDDGVSEQTIKELENIDLAGRSIDQFASDLEEDAIIDGHALFFVDWSVTDPRIGQRKDVEDAFGARPYWINLKKSQIRSFRTTRVGGRIVLTQIAWHETAVEPDGPFADKEVERMRVYRLGNFALEEGGEERQRVQHEVWIKTKNEDREEVWKIDPERGGVLPIDEIPLIAVYTNRTGYQESEPPLLDLAYENVRHFQLRSDRDNTMHVAGVPIPVWSGIREGEDLVVGPNHGVILPQGGSGDYMEPMGSSLSETREELRDTERRMALLGLSMLMSESRAAETAESKRIDAAESHATLQASANNLEAGLKEGLRLHAKWKTPEAKRTGEIEGGALSVNRDFEQTQLSPQMVEALSRAVEKSHLSLETMWDILIQGELLPDTFDPDEEHARIGSGIAKQLAAFVGRDDDDGEEEGPKPTGEATQEAA